MATETIVKPLRHAVDRGLSLMQKDLVQRPIWGELTFEEARLDLDRAKHLINQLNIMPLEYLTDAKIQEVTGQLNTVCELLAKIDNFKIVDNALSVRTSIIQSLHGAVDRFTDVAGPVIPFLAYQRGDVAENIGKLNTAVSEAKELSQQARRDIEKELAEIKKITEAARAASAKAGVAHFTQDFEEESDLNSAAARKWLWATGGFASSTIVAALITIPIAIHNPNLTNPQLFQILIAKLLILSVLFSATLWCGRLYKASLHQATLNKHRSIALTTFQAFNAAASDEQTKNAVLLETTRSIFNVHSTGLLDEKVSDDGHGTKIIEIIKAIGPRTSG